MVLELSQKEQIYIEYCENVTRYVRGKITNSADTEDVVSEVFLKVYGKLDTFDETKASLSTWIYHITQNTVTDYFRRHRVFTEIPETVSDGKSMEDELISEENLNRLADGLEKLDERARNLIVLHYHSGMILKDIAQKMGISYVYAKVLHKKALDQLRIYLDQ